MHRRTVTSLVFIAAIALAACSADVSSPLAFATPQRDDSPAQTDSLVYHLQRNQNEYRAWVTTTYTNRTGHPVYYRRCTSSSTTPMFWVTRTGTDSARTLFTDWAWACVGGVPVGTIVPGATATVRAPVGSVDQYYMQPALQPQDLTGMMRVHFQLCRSYVADSDSCQDLPAAEAQSNAFLVTY